MTRRPVRGWRRLAPLVVLVVVAHAALLLWLQPIDLLRPTQPPATASFATRTIAPPEPAPEPAAVVADASAAPAPVVKAAPPPVAKAAPAPRPAPQSKPALSAAPRSTPTPPAALPAAIESPPPAPAAPRVAAATSAPAPAPASAARQADAAASIAPAAPAPATPSPAPHVAVPPSARYHYDVAVQAKGFNLRGKGELEWRHDGHAYEAKLELSNPFLPRRIQRSTGRITEDGLAPAYFLDKSRSEQAAHFERDKGRVTFSNNRPPEDLVPGLQDRLSVLLQLSAMAAGQPARFRPGAEIVIPTASTREAEDWIFAVEGEEDLQLPGGAVRALKLHRKPRKEFDLRLELWLAPRMDYAPVRVRLTNPNGDTVDQRWSSTDKG
ncbi:MAG: DUF3108 domain-containing protein [Comamonadaceae bacterium]|nr:MAG: DUF3108 domain-containing protein [Comamonadaceae bacterium]